MRGKWLPTLNQQAWALTCPQQKLSESNLQHHLQTKFTELREQRKDGEENKLEYTLELTGCSPPPQPLYAPFLCPSPEKPFHLERKKRQRDHSLYRSPPLPQVAYSMVKGTRAVLLALERVFSKVRPVSQAPRDGARREGATTEPVANTEMQDCQGIA